MTSERTYSSATEFLMNHTGPLHIPPQPPTTFPELLKVMEHEWLTSMFRKDGDDTDPFANLRAVHSANNNNEAGDNNDNNCYLEELSINVDPEEESGHSWRPSVANALSPDFFLKPLDDRPRNPVPVQPPLTPEELRIQEVEQMLRFGRKIPSNQKTQSIQGAPLLQVPQGTQIPQEAGYVQSQKDELNILKYEVMSAKRKISDSRTAIRELSCRLNEVSKFQNSQEIEKLTKENAQLRLECQCLCMEVDFYLKGQAPLGEVDENFYKEKSSESETTQAEPKPSQAESRSGDYAEEELEEDNKWECHQCTFANHPAINSCEMCHVPRRRRSSQVQCSSQDTCFCHPRENAPSS